MWRRVTPCGPPGLLFFGLPRILCEFPGRSRVRIRRLLPLRGISLRLQPVESATAPRERAPTSPASVEEAGARRIGRPGWLAKVCGRRVRSLGRWDFQVSHGRRVGLQSRKLRVTPRSLPRRRLKKKSRRVRAEQRVLLERRPPPPGAQRARNPRPNRPQCHPLRPVWLPRARFCRSLQVRRATFLPSPSTMRLARRRSPRRAPREETLRPLRPTAQGS